MGGCCSTQGGGSNDACTEITMAEAPIVPHGRVQPRGVRKGIKGEPANPIIQKTNPYSSMAMTTAGTGLPPGISELAVRQMMDKAEKGFEVLVLLANGYGLEATLQVDKAGRKVRITKNDQEKELGFQQITKVIYTPDELAKVKTSAMLDNCCAALCTDQNNQCIVFCFESPEDAKGFVGAAYRYVTN